MAAYRCWPCDRAHCYAHANRYGYGYFYSYTHRDTDPDTHCYRNNYANGYTHDAGRRPVSVYR